MCKLLWNLCDRAENLWVRWIHFHYVKDDNIEIVPIRKSFSWILKAILKVRQDMVKSQFWCIMLQQPRYHTKKMYISMKDDHKVVQWRKILNGNVARPIANHILWMACCDRLATKDRINRFVLLDSASNLLFLQGKRNITAPHVFLCNYARNI